MNETSTTNYEPSPPYRLAKLSDAPFIYRLIKEKASRFEDLYGASLDASAIADTIADVMQRGILIVGPASCAAARFGPLPFNHQVVVANILFWYFKTPREIQIFDEICNVCKNLGATHVNASSHFPDNRLIRFYEKRGLVPIETQTLGRL